MSITTPSLHTWLRESAPDCGDNSCLFGGRGKGGMRTNGGCRCFSDVRPGMKRIFIERLWASFLAQSETQATKKHPVPGCTYPDCTCPPEDRCIHLQPDDKRSDTPSSAAETMTFEEYWRDASDGLGEDCKTGEREFMKAWAQDAWNHVIKSLASATRTIPIDDNMIANAKHAQQAGTSRVTMSVPVDWILPNAADRGTNDG